MLEPVLLLLLHYGPSHGYTLIARLEDFGLGALSPSVVYRVLRNMEERGWVDSTWDEEETQGPPRRVYSLSADGDSALAHWARDLEANRKLIDLLLAEYNRHMAQGVGEHHRSGEEDQPNTDEEPR